MYQIFDCSSADLVAQMEQFVKKHPKGHFLQLPQWANAKHRWLWKGVMVYQKGLPAGAMSVLIRPLPFGFSILYAPRGPVCDRTDRQALQTLLDAAQEIAKAHRALLLYLDPDEPDTNQGFRSMLTGLGFREKSDDGFGNIQAQHVFRLNLNNAVENDIFQHFSSKTRYNIRLAQRKGVVIREYSGSDTIPEAELHYFSEIMGETGKRDGFQVREQNYFSGVLKALQNDARLFLAYYQDIPIAGSIESFCGDKAWYLYGASSNAHRNVMPNYLLQWAMIRRAMERDCRFYDFRGVPGNPKEEHPLYGLYRFKSGFSGTFTKFSGLFTYYYRPILGSLFVKLLDLRNYLFKKHYSPHKRTDAA